MNDSERDFLLNLLNTPSPTGFEIPGQKVWAEYNRSHADSVENDAYGNTWATLGGDETDGLTVMIEAHADEIGYMVKHITKEGFLFVDRIGGSDWATARGRRITILGDKGEVKGIIGNTAIHIRDRENLEKGPKVHELAIDIGASSAEDVAELGIRVGHPAVYSDAAELFGKNQIIGRALDNRIGGFIISQVMKKLAAEKQDSTCIALNAIQEEIGGYGAKMASYRLMPDVCLVLDVTHATDSPGIEEKQHGTVKLGGGPSITHGTANHPLVVQRMMQVAEEKGITLQHEASSRATGTDTDSIYHIKSGIPSALVSLPLRYMHSVVEMADLDDVQNVIDFMAAFVSSIKKDDSFAHVV
ncbi:M42 family metallopeptidase [Verrucomicrobiales bacterium]|nr:M42 family metallopeptidase [Verrucomicrobiales bacterium]MDB4662726.1 M42 family metallopeptidase [Verrucomicrobiales bacterium]MDC0258756.1 M42 family metallopeptidase [Verrucomicrobiales bacterium]